ANITSVGRASFCSGDPYGGPQQTQRVFLTAQAGYVSKPSGFWRASGGPVFSWQTTRFQELMTAPGTNSNAPTIGAVDQSSYTIGLETPVYLNFASGPEKYVGDYKGLLRVTPSALFTHFDSGGWDKALFVKVELLGQRTMFAKVLDW
ncbi:MAG TPA: hypothetical protein VKW77_05200, partial [Acidimicrobiales bacterium]|nr:hypothetical protein [Acidimicrobiales bacterium]